MLFSKNHLWIKPEGDTARLGISDYGVEKLGNIVFLNLPEVGDWLTIEEKLGDVESIKTVSDLISPVTGQVLSVNGTLLDDPGSIGDDPYENWLIEVKIHRLSDELLTVEEYQIYRDECNG